MDAGPAHNPHSRTSVGGEVRSLDGLPLPDVTARIGDQAVRTDEAGRFVLGPIGPGHRELVIDGRTAGPPKSYGIFDIGIELRPGRMHHLPYTIWMPALDTENVIGVPTPTTDDIILSTPKIPGLEIHLPAGSTIRDRDGAAITQLTITPIPVSRPPFPLPFAVEFTMYFTVQPGGAYIEPYGARIVYPNVTRLRPGTRTGFWNYDPTSKHWHMYGRGIVTPDGKQVVPDAGVVAYRLTGSSVFEAEPTGPSPAGGSGGFAPGPSTSDGDPIDLATGLPIIEKTDIFLPDTIPIFVKRTHRPGRPFGLRPFGLGSSHYYELVIFVDDDLQEAHLMLPHGGMVRFARSVPAETTDPIFEHATSPSIFYRSRLRKRRHDWILTLKDGTVYTFGGGVFPLLMSIEDRNGNRVNIGRLDGEHGKITRITSPNGRWLELTLDTDNIVGKVDRVRDNSGRTVTYHYDDKPRLIGVTDVMGGVTFYTYDAFGRIVSVTDPRGLEFLRYEYDDRDRCVREIDADGAAYAFSYMENADGVVVQTEVTDPRGDVRRVTFNDAGYVVTDTRAVGTPIEQTLRYERAAESNLVVGIVDALGRTTSQTYDDMGNVVAIDDPAASSATQLTYEPRFQQIVGIARPALRPLAVTHDAAGRPNAVSDTAGVVATITNNAAGQPAAISDAAGNSVQIVYTAGLLSGFTNELGATGGYLLDPAGRPTRHTDPLGRVTRFTYDAHNQLTELVDPLGGLTRCTYDPNGNLVSVIDPLGGTCSYAYDTMDRLAVRTDQLGNAEAYQYDPAGNLVHYTDRAGQVTQFTYDALNRRTQASYPDGATVDYDWDAADRPTRIVDSLSGTLTFEYGPDDLVQAVSTPQGSITYTYDAAGRRTTMTVAGEPPVTYTYDETRLVQISRGSITVRAEFDMVGRPSRVRLPLDVTVEYGYDAASRPTEILFTQAGDVLGNLTYEYDAGGRRIGMGGSLARVIIPEAAPVMAYDSANRLVQFGPDRLSYDDNGNLTDDGVNTYAWDARGQLTTISGPGGTTSFRYDTLGRRIAKTANGTTREYLYDFLNVVLDRPAVHLLAGLGWDEWLVRADAEHIEVILPDAIGSTLGVAAPGGGIHRRYSYEPFGAATQTGGPSANPFQYTGRENDGTGTYYYRARYYSPSLRRFISEDPQDATLAELNRYVYALNDPVNRKDPLGRSALDAGNVADCALMLKDLRERMQQRQQTSGRKDPVDDVREGVEELNRGIRDWIECLAPVPVVAGPVIINGREYVGGSPLEPDPSHVGPPPPTSEGYRPPRRRIRSIDELLGPFRGGRPRRPPGL